MPLQPYAHPFSSSLVDAGRTVVEASIIVEHLDVFHPGRVRFIPADPRAALDVPEDGVELEVLDLRWLRPLDDVTIPIKLNVPVDIAMADTELAPQFQAFLHELSGTGVITLTQRHLSQAGKFKAHTPRISQLPR